MALSENVGSFLEKQKRNHSIHIQVVVDQTDTVGKLTERLHAMAGLNLIGRVNIDGQDVELTKLAVYVLKDARKQNITLLFEESKTFEDIGVMDKQWLAATEVLTEAGK